MTVTAAFFDSVRPLFGGSLSQAQVDHLNTIFAAWDEYGDGNPRNLAYILATAKHESGSFKFLKEIWGPTPAQSGYEGRASLGNTVKGDGKRFMGRGYVQITGRRNYADWSKRLGIDLLSSPSKASEPEIAARILVEGMMLGTFTGKKLNDYPNDFVSARAIVNGRDRATLIAGYAYSFLEAIEKSAPKPTKPEQAAPTKPPAFAPQPSFLAMLIRFILSLFGARK